MVLPDIIITGLKHSGKTVQGLKLARQFRAVFIDLDEQIARLVQVKYPGFVPQSNDLQDHGSAMKLVRLFFREYGKDAFQELEAEAFQLLDQNRLTLEPHALDHVVGRIIALGGGAMENKRLMDLRNPMDCLVFLDAPWDTLYERIIKGGIPPFLDPLNPEGSFKILYERRRLAALESCNIHIDLGNLGIEEAGKKIEHLVQEYFNGR